jgi:uncharacterized protein
MKVLRIMTFLLTYLLILLAIFLLQRKMMYFPTRFTQSQQEEFMADLNLKYWPSANEPLGLMSKNSLLDAKALSWSFTVMRALRYIELITSTHCKARDTA